MSDQNENALAEFFVSGVEPADIPQLFPLLQARPLIGALIGLFRGGDEEVLVRLMVLREIGLRADAPEWSPQELNSRFSFITEAKFNTVLHRLREHELLLWDAERRIYQLSTSGRMVLSAISNLINFGSAQDGELGFLAAQVAAGSAMGKLSPENLSHLLARLTELEQEFEQARNSGSEFRLRAAQSKLVSVQQWMDKASEVLRNLSRDGLDDATWKLSQQIGHRQSKLMRMASMFQRDLAEIARQQVHLSRGGLNSSELAAWLKQRSIDNLAQFAEGQCALIPECTFVLPDVMVDNTEEFIVREQPHRRVSQMPAAATVEYVDDVPHEPPPQLDALIKLLARLETAMPLADSVIGGGFSDASYRLSLLAFLGERNVDPELAPLSDLPVHLCWSEKDTLQIIARNEVAAMSNGYIEPLADKQL